ncbi:RNA-binding S4 domain-containing protein [Miniphocaeibacter massiliensis]|uniref:RNA-binding S4 domain-containing protein n=1 Tax=Miniphocaeibacter massiliensis TaxID=2041841 RepID=UPI000C0808CD|nr:RNA-binding S4 domain-containing protein [Miniphocaeibacter massiliensis]
MRIDKFLKNSRIIKRRTIAKEACDGKRVSINGKLAKSGDIVKIGDIIEVRFGNGELKVIVKEIIDNPKKEQAADMIEKME